MGPPGPFLSGGMDAMMGRGMGSMNMGMPGPTPLPGPPGRPPPPRPPAGPPPGMMGNHMNPMMRNMGPGTYPQGILATVCV